MTHLTQRGVQVEDSPLLHWNPSMLAGARPTPSWERPKWFRGHATSRSVTKVLILSAVHGPRCLAASIADRSNDPSQWIVVLALLRLGIGRRP